MENQGILVYLESTDGQILKVSLEAMNAARKLAQLSGKKVGAVLIGDASAAAAAASYGADEVLTVAAHGYQPDRYTDILTALCERYDVSCLLLGSTRDGKELAARVAARTGSGCISDAMSMTESGAWVRSVYGGSLQETVSAKGKAVVTVRSGTFGKPELDEGRTAPVTAETVDATPLRSVIKDAVQELSESVNLEDAEIIVAGGRGMGSAENFQLVHELATLLGGVVGASRPAIEDGWVLRNHQVGQSGKIVAPKLYIACGISGAMQHVSGMSGSGFIVAINKDEDAPIFEVADVGIVGNVTEILPLLIEEVKARKN
ncbi:electron transfer flavoprotein subunit alpha/FixB family protein [Oscillibacter sp.]|uniref:electron transfer flavoprotein subunit alpha/FixB family protein n=1 Tax=Oscillibacter sp. TaxID=1945593 RepID=UPI002626201E|nr:electron transfer flavoprotein subunit alpha/FixB family protein [Oscillibacter sp.]MDD3346198.1 electron transfer flavoprotein subunit alpha/FixB family protein [Oscillibacter sp.]